MKKTIGILILVLILNFTGLSFSKDSTKTSNFKHEIGFHIGSTSGYGPSYRIWYKKFGLQASFLPYIRYTGDENYSGNYFNYTYGISLNYLIKENKYVNFFSFLNASTRSLKNGLCYIEICTPPEFTHNSNVGFGFGFDFKFLTTMKLSTQIGYGLYNIQGLTKGNIAGGISLLYSL